MALRNLETNWQLGAANSSPRIMDDNLTEFPWGFPVTRTLRLPRTASLSHVPTQLLRSSSLRMAISDENLKASAQSDAPLQAPAASAAASADCAQPPSKESSETRSRSTSFSHEEMRMLIDGIPFDSATVELAHEFLAQRNQPHGDAPGEQGRVSIPSVPAQTTHLAIASVAPIQTQTQTQTPSFDTLGFLSDLNGTDTTLCPAMQLGANQLAAHVSTPPGGYEYYVGHTYSSQDQSSEVTHPYIADRNESSDQLVSSDDSSEPGSDPHAHISVLQPPSEPPSSDIYRNPWWSQNGGLAPPLCIGRKQPATSIDPRDVIAPPQGLNAGGSGGTKSSSSNQRTNWLASPASSSPASPEDEQPEQRDASMSQSLSSSSNDTTSTTSDSSSSQIPSSARNTSTPKKSGAGNNEPAMRLSPTNRVEVACNFCKRRKLRCSGERPHCSECSSRGHAQCEYSTEIKRRGKAKKTLEREARQAALARAKQEYAQGLITQEELDEAKEAAINAESSKSSSPAKKRQRPSTGSKSPRKSSKPSTSD